jgi:mannosyl-oligosaccharide glucosidase
MFNVITYILIILFFLEESIFVCHKGYLSLFPMVLELLPNGSPKLGAILDMIYNPNELWSK